MSAIYNKYQIKNIVNSWWAEVVPTGFSSLFSSKSKYEFHINGRVTTIEESLNDELLLYKGITNLLNCSKYVEVCKVHLNYIYSDEFQAYIDAANRMSLTECSYISFTLEGGYDKKKYYYEGKGYYIKQVWCYGTTTDLTIYNWGVEKRIVPRNPYLFRRAFLMFLRMYFLYTLCNEGSMCKGCLKVSSIRQIVEFCLENNMIKLVELD